MLRRRCVRLRLLLPLLCVCLCLCLRPPVVVLGTNDPSAPVLLVGLGLSFESTRAQRLLVTAQLALDAMNADTTILPNTRLQFLFGDTKGLYAPAALLAGDFIAQGASVIIGDSHNDGTQGLVDTARVAGVPVISASASQSELSAARPYFMRTCPSDAQLARLVIDALDNFQAYASEIIALAVIHSADTYGAYTYSQLQRSLAEYSIPLAADIALPPLDAAQNSRTLIDLLTPLVNAASVQPLLLYVPLNGSLSAPVLQAASTLGLLRHPNIMWLASDDMVRWFRTSRDPTIDQLVDGMVGVLGSDGLFNRKAAFEAAWSAFVAPSNAGIALRSQYQWDPNVFDGLIDTSYSQVELYMWDAVAVVARQLDKMIKLNRIVAPANTVLNISSTVLATQMLAGAFSGASGSVMFYSAASGTSSGDRRQVRYAFVQVSLNFTRLPSDPDALGIENGYQIVGHWSSTLGCDLSGPQLLRTRGAATGWLTVLGEEGATIDLAGYSSATGSDVWAPTPAQGVTPPARFGACVVNDRSSMYVLGGSSSPSASPLADTWEYSFVTQLWSRRPLTLEQPSPRSFSGCMMSLDQTYILVYGGLTSDGLRSDVWQFFTATNEWTRVAYPPVAGPGLTNTQFAVAINMDASGLTGQANTSTANEMVVWGGRGLKPDLFTVWRFSLATTTWQAIVPTLAAAPLLQPDMPDYSPAASGFDPLTAYNVVDANGCISVRTIVGGVDAVFLLGCCFKQPTPFVMNMETKQIHPFWPRYLNDGDSSRLAQPAPFDLARCYAATAVAVLADGTKKAYITSGFTSLDQSITRNLVSVDLTCPGPTCGYWQVEADLLSSDPRESASLVLYGNDLLTWGGWGDTKIHNDFTSISVEGRGALTTIAKDYFAPSARRGHSLVAVANQAVLFGGVDARGVNNDLYLLNLDMLVSAAWTPYTALNAPPPARTGHTAVSLSSLMFIFGGRSDSNECFADLWSLSLSVNLWELIKPAVPFWSGLLSIPVSPIGRAFHSAAVLDDSTFLVACGLGQDGGLMNDLWSYSLANASWTMLLNGSRVMLPSAAQLANVTVDQQSIDFELAVSDAETNDLLVNYGFDATTTDDVSQFTTTLGVAPAPRAYASMVVLGGRVFLISGENSGQAPLSDTWVLDISANLTWQPLPNSKIDQRKSAVALAVGDSKIYLFGGENYETVSDSLQVYDLKRTPNAWSKQPVGKSVSSPRRLAGSAGLFYGSRLFFFGGTTGAWKSSIHMPSVFVNEQWTYVINTTSSGCSAGTVPFRSGCRACSPGTYWQRNGTQVQCVPCALGFFSSFKGAASPTACVPCAAGTYNLLSGSARCLACTSSQYCPLGSAYPLEPLGLDASITGGSSFALVSSQPKPSTIDRTTYVTDLQTAMTLIVGLTIVGIVFGYVCLICCNRQHVFLRLDRLFAKQHLTMYDVPIYKRRTSLGGLCSILLVMLILFVVGSASLPYFLNNLSEQRALVPNISVDSSQKIAASITAAVTIQSYRGVCVQPTSGATLQADIALTSTVVTIGSCAPGVSFQSQGISTDPAGLHLQCVRESRPAPQPATTFLSSVALNPDELGSLLSNDDCTMIFTCDECTVGVVPVLLNFTFDEAETYATAIRWRIKASTGLPLTSRTQPTDFSPIAGGASSTRVGVQQWSELNSTLYAPTGSFFRGIAVPTMASLRAQPTIYKRPSVNIENAGYHMDLGGVAAGSTTSAKQFHADNGVQFTFHIERTLETLNVGVVTVKTWIGFLGDILGSGTGIFAACAVMMLIGEHAEEWLLTKLGRPQAGSRQQLRTLLATKKQEEADAAAAAAAAGMGAQGNGGGGGGKGVHPMYRTRQQSVEMMPFHSIYGGVGGGGGGMAGATTAPTSSSHDYPKSYDSSPDEFTERTTRMGEHSLGDQPLAHPQQGAAGGLSSTSSRWVVSPSLPKVHGRSGAESDKSTPRATDADEAGQHAAASPTSQHHQHQQEQEHTGHEPLLSDSNGMTDDPWTSSSPNHQQQVEEGARRHPNDSGAWAASSSNVDDPSRTSPSRADVPLQVHAGSSLAGESPGAPSPSASSDTDGDRPPTPPVQRNWSNSAVRVPPQSQPPPRYRIKPVAPSPPTTGQKTTATLLTRSAPLAATAAHSHSPSLDSTLAIGLPLSPSANFSTAPSGGQRAAALSPSPALGRTLQPTGGTVVPVRSSSPMRAASPTSAFRRIGAQSAMLDQPAPVDLIRVAREQERERAAGGTPAAGVDGSASMSPTANLGNPGRRPVALANPPTSVRVLANPKR